MLRCLPRSTAAFALLVACASDPAGPPAPDASAADGSADAPAADVSADAPAADVSPDAPAADGSPDAPAADGSPDAPAADGNTPIDGSTPRARLEGLVDEVARGLCGALYRCCDASSRASFFAPLRAAPQLAALRDRIPADGVLDRAACAPLLAEAYGVVPLGGWVRAALAGRVSFRASEADACLARLADAACGAAVTEALLDGTCFGFGAPEGGAAQRRMFARTDAEGAPCAAIADGVGGAIYGNCDPARAFCCGGTAGRCAVVGGGTGTCRAVAALGAACGLAPELRVCATGIECDASRCTAVATTPLNAGDTCAMGVRLLGSCRDSFCDIGRSDRCVALARDGATCSLPYECQSGSCAAGRCAAATFCIRP